MKKYIFKYKLLFFTTILISLIISVLQIAEAYALKMITDVAVSKSLDELRTSLIYCVSIGLGIYISKSVYAFMKNKFICKTLVHIKNEAYNGIVRKDIVSFKKVDIGSYTSNLTNDIDVIESDYMTMIFEVVRNLMVFIFAIVSLVMISPLITIYVCIISLLPMFIAGTAGGKRREYVGAISKMNERITSKSKGIFQGFELIKAYNIENKVKKDFENYNEDCEESKLKASKYVALISGVINMTHMLILLSPVILAAYMAIKGKFSVGTVIQILQLMNYVGIPIIVIPSSLPMIKGAKPVMDKILGLIDSKSNTLGSHEKNLFEYDITFKDVCFAYDENKPLLSNASLTIKKGEKCAIVGNSGCGKSTFVKLFMRFYDNYEGSISIDGMDIKEIKIDDIYKLICPINQKVYMFNDTVKNNVKLYNDYDDSDTNEAMMKSGLKELIDKLPQGVDSEVGESGSNLSGGEKQRISIARAFIKNCPIFVVDEATSSLDNETAYNIETSLLEEKNLTCLVVTHKLNKEILERYDKIVVMNNGTVDEEGTFEELMKRKEYFYSLYNVAN